ATSEAPAPTGALPAQPPAPAMASAGPTHQDAPATTPPEPAKLATKDPPGQGTGRLFPPPAAKSHRIFIDGKVQSKGLAPIKLPCGEHRLKIGGSGAPIPITIPCNGDLRLGAGSAPSGH